MRGRNDNAADGLQNVYRPGNQRGWAIIREQRYAESIADQHLTGSLRKSV